jgi:hypothetical protein
MSLHPAIGFAKGPVNTVGGVRIEVVNGPCGEEVPYKAPIGILYGLSIRDSTNRRITS